MRSGCALLIDYRQALVDETEVGYVMPKKF